jgi:hypothetical protein
MSKNENNATALSGSLHENQGDQNPSGQTNLGGNKPPEKGKPENPTIEEHAKAQNINAPIFAALMQSQKWASGKRVPEAVFNQAVKGFLGAPMGGLVSSGAAASKGGA